MIFKRTCNEIISTCGASDTTDKLDKKTLAMLIYEIEATSKFNENKTNITIKTHQKLTEIKNRKATWMEDEIGLIILRIPSGFDNENHWLSEERRLKIKEILRDYAEKIIEFASQKPKSYRTKRIEKRIAFATELLSKLQ